MPFAFVPESPHSTVAPAKPSRMPTRPVIRLPGLRLPRSVLGHPLQALQRVCGTLAKVPREQAIQKSAPPPGREGEASAVPEVAAPLVERGAHDPVVAEDPDREGHAEPNRVPLSVHLQDLTLEP